MALTRIKKAENVTRLAAELAGSTSAIVGTFSGLTASKDFELRKAVRSAGGNYHVVKNKLAARASEGSQIAAALQGLKGVSSVAYTSGDPVALAKALSTWVKDNAQFTFKLGIVDGKVITVEEIGALATLPGKEELFSKLLFLINSPAQRLATVINATGRNLAVVVDQAVEQGKFKDTGEAAPAAKAAEVEAAEAKPTDVAASQTTAVAEGATLAAGHAEEAPDASSAVASEQPENVTASQGGEAATSDPVEG